MEEKGEILVVDDERTVADALKTILEDDGFKVTLAASGCDGIENARGRRFSLAITDLRLPDMSGLDVLTAVLAENPRCAVILISAYGTPEIFADALSRGAAGVLSKPFLPSQILSLVRSAVDRLSSEDL